MPSSRPGMPDPAVLRSWFDDLQRRDPDLYAELAAKLPVTEESIGFETVGGIQDDRDIALETIVLREGRPVLPVRENKIADAHKADAESREIVKRLVDAAAVVEPAIPLVGRIDVANHAGGFEFVGTGWLVDENLVVTNRHVAELIARWDGAKYVFRPGKFGDPLQVSIDYLREPGGTAQASAAVQSVEWIVPEPTGPDLALLKVARRTDGTFPKRIELADDDPVEDANVVVIGYPARAPAHVIRDQALMDEIYGGVYDVKRIAPGKMKGKSRGWSTHDCTTLGGNSGSVVLDMTTGRAVALHFAGLYMIENYCVPASTMRKYLDPANRKPIDVSRPEKAEPPKDPSTSTTATTTVDAAAAGGEISITIPVTIKVSLGQPMQPVQQVPPAPKAQSVESAARAFFNDVRREGVYAVRPGYVVENGKLTGKPAVVVKAHPSRIDEVRASLPATFGAYPVEVRPASIVDQTGDEDFAQEAVTEIGYKDRTGDDFSFEWVEEEMTGLLHVGPERSWTVLSGFLGETRRELVSSIYEFHAKHIADAIEQTLRAGAKLTLVMGHQSRDPKDDEIREGDFDRSDTFDRWGSKFSGRFDRIFVPIGRTGLVATSYHIKVTVQDGKNVWLSSGNWKARSQPLIAEGDLGDPKKMTGNREWHAVLHNETLARRFRNHILEDLEQCRELGGTEESMGAELFVDVPERQLESIELEAVPSKLIEPLEIEKRTVRVKPLLTPDKKGAVFSKAVLQLIRSARKQLLFQIPYITVTENTTGFLDELVEALVERSNEIDDVRIIIGSSGSAFLDTVSELKRRGMDVNRCVRRMSHTHTKGMVVDRKKVLVGSHNWSTPGVTLNRDASLIFDDRKAAEYYAEAFEVDWDRLRDLEIDEESVFAEAPRLADPAEPTPPGFVRMTLDSYLEG